MIGSTGLHSGSFLILLIATLITCVCPWTTVHSYCYISITFSQSKILVLLVLICHSCFFIGIIAYCKQKFHNYQITMTRTISLCREIEVINEKEKRKDNCMYLMVEFPHVAYKDLDYAVVYFEKDGDEPVYVSHNQWFM